MPRPAQVGVASSNSLIEAWWRSLTQRRLLRHPRESAARALRLVGVHVEQHKAPMPHTAPRAYSDRVEHGAPWRTDTSSRNLRMS